jgi:acyl carrier protein
MNDEEILSKLNNIFISVFDDEHLLIVKETTANDIKAWDSLNHLHLIASIEKHFKIKFKTIEAQEFKNVEEICIAIRSKIKRN